MHQPTAETPHFQRTSRAPWRNPRQALRGRPETPPFGSLARTWEPCTLGHFHSPRNWACNARQRENYFFLIAGLVKLVSFFRAAFPGAGNSCPAVLCSSPPAHGHSTALVGADATALFLAQMSLARVSSAAVWPKERRLGSFRRRGHSQKKTRPARPSPAGCTTPLGTRPDVRRRRRTGHSNTGTTRNRPKIAPRKARYSAWIRLQKRGRSSTAGRTCSLQRDPRARSVSIV